MTWLDLHPYLKTLCDELKEPFDPSLTKAEASRRIDELRARDPRISRQQGEPHKAPSRS